MIAFATLRYAPLALNKRLLSIGLIWLFYVSAMIGITLGHLDWFVSKTPFTLLLVFALSVWNFPVDTPRKWLCVALFFAAGMAAEWVGVHTGVPFGTYAYGENLGPKLDGVPWLIGVNWAVLTLFTGALATAWVRSLPLRVLLGAALMVGLDVLLEHAAPVFDYWTFAGGTAPVENYLAWFGLAAALHYVFQRAHLHGDVRFSWHAFGAQVVYFGYFWVIM